MKTVEQTREHLDADIADISDDKHNRRFGADSLHTVELVMLFEQEYGIEDGRGSDSLVTVGAIKEYIDGLQ